MGVRVYPLGQGANTALRNEERGKRVPRLQAGSSRTGGRSDQTDPVTLERVQTRAPGAMCRRVARRQIAEKTIAFRRRDRSLRQRRRKYLWRT